MLFFAKWPVCFDISEDERMASQTVDTHFWSQLWRLLFWFGKLSHDFFTFIFCNQKYISAFILFVSGSIFFASYLNLSFASRFFVGKFEKVHEFNRVWALMLSTSSNFLSKVCLWYRACLQRPTYGIGVFLVRSIHGLRAFLIRPIHGPRVFLQSRMSGRRAFLTRSCYGFHIRGQGCAFLSYLWDGKPG